MSIRLKTTIFILFVLFIGVGNIYITLQLEKYGNEKLDWVNHTNEVLMETERLLNALQGTETGQRGYLLTTDQTYLEPYTSGITDIKRHFDNLLSLTLDNPIQQDRLHSLKEIITLKLNELNTTINYIDNNKAIEIVTQNTGKLYMDKIRSLLKEFHHTEITLLQARTDDYTNNRDIIRAVYYVEILLFALIALIAVLFLNRSLFIPLQSLRSKMNTMQNNQNVAIEDVMEKNEIGSLFSGFYDMYTTISEKTEKLENYQEELERKVEQEVEKNKQHSANFIQQSRLAQMGEMISMIAHQWRQPLASISAISGTLTLDVMMDQYKKEFFHERLEAITELSQHLSSTIDDFRNFHKPDKKPISALLHEPIRKALTLIEASFKSQSIIIKEREQSQTKLQMHENELVQVVLSILKNSQDNFTEKNIENPTIDINVYDKNNCVFAEILDNGGGISKDIIDKVFDPYFTTKDKKDGTDLGLYMSKLIIEEHHKGRLQAINVDNGVKFVIELPITSLDE